MSLFQILETTPLEYELCTVQQLFDAENGGAGTVFYHPACCTDPRIYNEYWRSGNMWYDVNLDVYVANMVTKQAAWPSWGLHVMHFDPETGEQVARASDTGSLTDRMYTNGEFGKVYGNVGGSVFEVDSGTINAIGSAIVVKADVGGKTIKRFILNRQDQLIVLDQPMSLEVWNYQTGVLQGIIMKPGWTTSGMAYESNELGWAVTTDGDGLQNIMKFNYKTMAVETVTTIPQAEGSVSPSGTVAVAYDERRKNVAVFTQRPENVDGSAAHTLTIYKPFSDSTQMTGPVPTAELIPGKTTTFTAHLIGDRGEVGRLNPVTITNTGDGTILQSTVSPQSNGAIRFQYLSGLNPGSDTITLSTEL